MFQNRKLINGWKRLGWEETGSECLMGLGFPLEGDENVLGVSRTDGCTTF